MSKRIAGFISENLFQGAIVGVLLFFVTLMTAAFHQNIWSASRFYVLPIAAGCMAAGIIILCVHRRKRKDFSHFGASGIYFYNLIYMAIFSIPLIISSTLPDGVFEIVRADVILLFALWLGEYLLLRNAAKKLNGSILAGKETIMTELKEKPGDTDEFYEILIKYCKDNNQQLEILQKEIPGKVMVDGQKYLAKIVMDYSFYGMPEYFLVLTTIIDEHSKQE